MRSAFPSIVAAVLGFLTARATFFDGTTRASSSTQAGAAPSNSAPSPAEDSPQSAQPHPSRPSLREATAAVNGNNAFVAAERWQAWLDSATAEELEGFIRDPKSLPKPWTSDFYHEFRDAFYAALVERWFALDENALPSIRKLHAAQKAEDDYEAARIMKAAIKARPEQFLTDLTAKKPSLSQDETMALRHLAARDARKARELVSSLTDKARKSAEVSIVQGIAETDPLSALALSRSIGSDINKYDHRGMLAAIVTAAERIGPGMLKQLFADAHGLLDDNYTAQMLVLRYPDLAAHMKPVETSVRMEGPPHPSVELFRQADLLTPEERARRVEQITAMQEGVRDFAAAALAASWAREEPLKAAEWAMKLAKPNTADSWANQAAHFAFLRWIHVDRPAAVAWLRTQPESPLRNAIGTNAASFLAEAGDFDAAMEFCRPTASKADQSAVAHLVQIYVERDPAGAAAWLAKIPEAISLETASRLFASWPPHDAEALGRWVEELPPGKGRDQAAHAMVERLRWDSPQAAAEWAETVADPALRQKAASFAFYPLNRDDPEHAREWLQNLKGVDPEWKERLLRGLQ